MPPAASGGGRAGLCPAKAAPPKSMSELVELTKRLVAIDSVNPELIPGAAGEDDIGRFIAEWFERAGLDVEVDEVSPGRPNVVGIARGSGGGRTLILNAHTDTVGVAGGGGGGQPHLGGGRPPRRGA